MAGVAYVAPPTVGRFLRSTAFVRAIVGPLGSGKSSGCVLEILRRATQQRPWEGVRSTRFVVIRNTYRELNDTTRKTFEQWVPESLGKWNEQDFTFTINTRLADGTRVHSEVLFRALDRPEHVKKLLSLELTGAYINEARQVPKAILDGLTGRVSRYPSMAQGGPSWFGIWMDTNPWHTAHWGYKLFSKERPDDFELFEQPGGLSPRAENRRNLDARYYERLCAGKDQEWVDEYVHAKYPSHDKGSVYGDLLAAVEARGGLLAFEHPTDNIFTTLDLGRSDSTSIWFWRLRPGGVDVVDHYRNHGQALSHYFGVLEERGRTRGYRYVKHWLPHDARAKTLAAGVSVLDQFISRFGAGAVAIGPALSLEDGIAAARWLLEQDVRFHARCDAPPVPGLPSGLEALRSYRYAYDERLQTFSRVPLHDWASHDADAWRYVGCVVKVSEMLVPAQPKPVEPPRPAGTLAEHKRFAKPATRGQGRIG
jgi:hypothetical protein